MTNKSNIVYLQFKLLSTHVRFGGQDGGEDDVREPLRRKNRDNKKCVLGGMRVTVQKQLGQVTEFKLAVCLLFLYIPVYKRGCVNQMHLPVM